MRKYLDEHPDGSRAADIEEIRKLLAPRG